MSNHSYSRQFYRFPVQDKIAANSTASFINRLPTKFHSRPMVPVGKRGVTAYGVLAYLFILFTLLHLLVEMGIFRGAAMPHKAEEEEKQRH